ncbi:MAG: crossover junction endodeoxyribonuclease RuvC [Deltaproteobacteria bacterium]
MIAFGIDPGSRRTGWGVVQAEGSRMIHLGSGVIRATESQALPLRLHTIHRELEEVLRDRRPDHVFVESVFHSKSAKSALVLGQARGVALLAAAQGGYPIVEITPAEVKKAVTGSGRAEKLQVQEMVKVLLGLKTRAPSDASDALALAIAGTAVLRWKIATGAVR